MSPLSIKFGLVSLVAHMSQVHGAPTCIGSGYLSNANFALSAICPNNQTDPTTKVMIYNTQGLDNEGKSIYATNTDNNEVCYPLGTTEAFALPVTPDREQHDGMKIEFTKPVKLFTLDMFDFGDWNPNQLAEGKVLAIAKKGEMEVAQDIVLYEDGGDACSKTLKKSKFGLKAEEFDEVLIVFESKTKDGRTTRELMDPNTSWGTLCYEAAEVDLTDGNASEVDLTDGRLSPENRAVDDPKYEKCAAPKMSDVGNMPEVSVCGDATYQLPATVALADVCSGSGDKPTGTVCPTRGTEATLACREKILSYFTGKPGTCVAPEDATCQKLLTGVWGCVFPSNCNTRNTCLSEEACSDEYEKDADGKCVLGSNKYPVAKAEYSDAVNTTAAEELPIVATVNEYSLASAGAAAMTVSGIIGLATAGTFVFSMM